MTETFHESFEHLGHHEISPDEIIDNPQADDIILVNPGTDQERKYKITHVGESKSISDSSTLPVEVIQYEYTLDGRRETHVVNRNTTAWQKFSVGGRNDVVKCYRRN